MPNRGEKILMKSWLWNFLIKLLQSLSRFACFLWVTQAAVGLVCSCQMGGSFRVPKSWFLGTLERPCAQLSFCLLSCLWQLQPVFSEPRLSLAEQVLKWITSPPSTAVCWPHTYPQTGPCSLHSCWGGWGEPALMWVLVQQSAPHPCCRPGSMGIWSRVSFSVKSDLSSEILDAMEDEEKSKVSFCDKGLTGLELFSFGGDSDWAERYFCSLWLWSHSILLWFLQGSVNNFILSVLVSRNTLLRHLLLPGNCILTV